jgi:hypothetical protein
MAEGEFEDQGSDSTEENEVPKWLNNKSVGIILSKLRLKKSREENAKRSRYREISPKEVAQLVVAHHLVHMSKLVVPHHLVHLKDNMSKTSGHVHMSDVHAGDQDTPPDQSRNGHRKQREVWYYPQRE